MSQVLLKASNLEKHYKTRASVVRALDGVNLEVFEGETLAVVGESGSGKTTLANMILGIETPTSGSLEYQSTTLTSNRSLELRQRIQYVQQNPMTTLNPRRTVFQSIALALETHKLRPRFEHRSRVTELLEVVGMSAENLDRFPNALSGGQRQRVAIARALAAEPQLLVLDEPTSALDVSVQAKVLTLLVELQAKFKLTYLFITHDLGVVRNVASRVAVMYRGKNVELGHTPEVFRDPEHPYTRMLISSIPVVSEEEEKLKPVWAWDRNLVLSSETVSSGCGFAPRCPYAENPCRSQIPPLSSLENNHAAACHMVSGVIAQKMNLGGKDAQSETR
jgi:peptide/nickel transport system ATP-binding protein/oligopeptide transport system ATP-binding protein